MSQPNAKTEVTLDIERMSYGPYGIGRHNGRVFMVPYTGPGDRIVARVAQDHERFSIAEIVRIISPSAARRPAPCPAFGFCGGCSWQHISYATQLQAKQQSVDDALCRIGKLDGYELRPIIPSPQEYGYRRRIRLQVGPGGTLGFFSASSHDLVQIESCGIAAPALNECLPALKRWVRRIGTALNEIELVSADEAYRLIVAARASGPFPPADEAACAELVAREGIQGLLLRGPGWQKRWGETQVDFEIAPGMTLKANADVFMQVNAAGNRLMLGSLLSLAEFRPDERVLELFSGCGNFTIPIARRTAAVVAVEADAQAVADGKRNAQRNGIANVRWIRASAPKALADLKRRSAQFTKVVLDPPRAGAKKITADIARMDPTKIVYISCNPATLARDLAALVKFGYNLGVVQPIDLFPQTFHVEAIALLNR